MADDLLDLQGPQLPSFLDMANASRPQMMPNSPSPYAGLMYGQDVSRHDTMMQKAAYLAEMRRRQDEQKQREFESAAPGRMDEIALKNRMAGVDLGDADTLASARSETNKGSVTAALAKASDAQQKLLKNYGVYGWDEAPDHVKRAIYKDAQAKHLAFADQSFEGFDGYMKHIALAGENEPNIMKSIYGSNMRLKGQEAVANSRVKAAEIHEAGRKAAEALRPHNMSTDQYHSALLQKSTDGSITEPEFAALNYLNQQKALSSMARIASAPATTSINPAGGISTTKPTLATPVVPNAPGGAAPAPVPAKVSPLPREISSRLKVGVGTQLSDGSVWTLGKDGLPQVVSPPTAK